MPSKWQRIANLTDDEMADIAIMSWQRDILMRSWGVDLFEVAILRWAEQKPAQQDTPESSF